MNLQITKFSNFPPSKWFIGKGWQDFGLDYDHALFVELRDSAGFEVMPFGNRGFYVKYNHALNGPGRQFAVMIFEELLRKHLKVVKLPRLSLDTRIRNRIHGDGEPRRREIWVQREVETPDANSSYILLLKLILIIFLIGFVFWYVVA